MIIIISNRFDYMKEVLTTDVNIETMAFQLKTLRKDRSLHEVAEALGITEASLSQYENGGRIPRDEVKIRLADYYGVSVDTIFLNKK